MWNVFSQLDRTGRGAGQAVLFGLVAAALAIGIRLLVSPDIGREQIVFSYPAVMAATFLWGARAGAITAGVCLAAAWYLVISPTHSWAVDSAGGITTLMLFVVVAACMIATIATLRTVMQRYCRLADRLQHIADHRTAERNRLWESSREVMAVVDRAGRIVEANPSFRNQFGEGAAGFMDLVVPRDRGSMEAEMAKLVPGASAAFESAMLGTSGPRTVAWSAVHDDERCYLVGRDLTEERACLDELRRSRKMSAVGQMTGGLAHDFANYLTPLSLGLESINRRQRIEEDVRALVGQLMDSVDRARGLVERLLAFAREEAMEPSVTSLATDLTAVLPLLEQVAGHRTLTLEVEPNLPAVLVDANELDTAMLNLVANARDASPAGSVILLRAARDGDQVCITVSDRGTGMDAAMLAKVKEPFFSTKRDSGGTGLGLPMVNAFARRAGGRLTIESEVGVGTSVHLILPAAVPAVA